VRAETIAKIQRRRSSIPWEEPIRVHLTCDDRPLFGCRLCILRYGLKAGDRARLFTDENMAASHTGHHAAAIRARPGEAATGGSHRAGSVV
jgi:hypothetical protein